MNTLSEGTTLSKEATLFKGTTLSEGATAKIMVDSNDPNYVYKIYKKKQTQKNNSQVEHEIHYEITEHLSEEMADLGVAVPSFIIDSQGRYRMRRIDTSKPMWEEDVWASLSANLQKEYLWRARIFLKSLAAYGIFLKDVEAYIQTESDTIMFIDFGQAYRSKPTTTFYLESATVLPYSITKEWVGPAQ